MLRKKSLLISGAGLTPLGIADAGPLIENASAGVAPGGGGCRVMNAGTMIKNRQTTSGSTANRLGSRQQKL